MQLAKVIGSMVSTRKCERLQGLKLLVAVPSRQTDLTTNKPVDSSIIGIVDFVDILGERKYRKGDER